MAQLGPNWPSPLVILALLLLLLLPFPNPHGSLSRSVAAAPAGAESEEPSAPELQALRPFGAFDLSSAVVRAWASAIHSHLTPWRAIRGLQGPLGSGRGLISPRILSSMANYSAFMSCSGHVRIVRGKLFFRLGEFVGQPHRMRRFVLTLCTIRRAIREYGLRSLSAEFFVRTCDLPQSSVNSESGRWGGYPLLGLASRSASLDIPIPDPLDMLPPGAQDQDHEDVLWDARLSVAVTRGGAINYRLYKEGNWKGSPRFRLHMMSHARPDLLDARIPSWTPFGDGDILRGIANDGIELPLEARKKALSNYKYEIVTDGACSSWRACAALSGPRVMFRQASQWSHFFLPLLKPYVHYIPVQHYFGDLYDQIEWAKANDAQAQHILANAHSAARWACTWRGRTLYWAVLLAKYSREALEDPSSITAPNNLCWKLPYQNQADLSPQSNPGVLPKGWPPVCNSEVVHTVQQPSCTFFCAHGRVNVKPYVWLSGDVLSDIPLDGRGTQ